MSIVQYRWWIDALSNTTMEWLLVPLLKTLENGQYRLLRTNLANISPSTLCSMRYASSIPGEGEEEGEGEGEAKCVAPVETILMVLAEPLRVTPPETWFSNSSDTSVTVGQFTVTLIQS